MKNINITALVLLTVIFAGCRQGKMADSPDAELVFREQGNEIIRAIAAKDFERYRRSGGDASGIAAGEDFLSSCQDMESRMGRMEKVEFLTLLETPGVVNLVFRIGFCRKTSDGKSVKHQQLFQLVFGKVDGKSQLLGMRIM